MPGLANGEEFLSHVYRRRACVALRLELTSNYFSDVEMARRCPRLYKRYLGELAPLEIPERHERFRMNVQEVERELRHAHRIDRIATNRWRAALPRIIRRIQARQNRPASPPSPPSRVPQLQRRPISRDRPRPPPFVTDGVDSVRFWNRVLNEDSEEHEHEEGDLVVEYRSQKERRRDLIRIMQKRFIEGDDEQYFDYSTVDNNDIFDDVSGEAFWHRHFPEGLPVPHAPNALL